MRPDDRTYNHARLDRVEEIDRAMDLFKQMNSDEYVQRRDMTLLINLSRR